MRVLHIIDHVGMGGAQTILKGIFEKNRDNKDIFYYALRNNKIKVEIDHPNIHSYKGYSKLNIRSFLELRKLIKKEKIDLIHCHLAKSIFFGYILKSLFFKKIRLIFHEHGRIFENQKLYNYFNEKAQNNVDLFIAVSMATKTKLIKNSKLEEHKIKILYNFVDLNKINPNNIKNYDMTIEGIDIDKDYFVVGFAGRLNKIKGCDLLIKSIPYIKIQNFKLLIAGDGPEKSRLEILAKELNIEDKIHFCGYIKNILKFYGLIDCFVLSSRSEASPMAFYEIQALGIPLIANDVIALNELIIDKENGLLFQTNNERDLAEKIELVYNNPELKTRMTIYGMENIKKYSINNYIKNLYKIYENVSTQHVDE
jgi:glycosyltransferase involved in cell wall biosynthesis